MTMQGYCDVYKWTILKRTSPEVKCLHPTSSSREMCTSSVSNVIYHKFSHGAAFYTFNRKNVNVMLEFAFFLFVNCLLNPGQAQRSESRGQLHKADVNVRSAYVHRKRVAEFSSVCTTEACRKFSRKIASKLTTATLKEITSQTD